MTVKGTMQPFEVMEKTWPPASRSAVGPWIIRDGQGGGQRVSATTDAHPFTARDLPLAEKAMRALGQPNLFLIRAPGAALDRMLEQQGYHIKDPVYFYSCPAKQLARPAPPRLSAFPVWPPLAIMDDLWQEGGIGTGRRAVMHRAKGPKTAILARQNDRAAGVAYVAMADGVAMLHALEVTPTQRRQGVGINIMRCAAAWAVENGASDFCVVVTRANSAANRLYTSLGMQNVGQYHYRIKSRNNGNKDEQV